LLKNEPMPEIRHFILATAGHVDHGKSALVKVLTGTDPDRLPEEQLRGITIDLGFAHLEIPSSDDPTSSLLLGIVDVPGHEDFVKNMVAGVGSIDLLLLAVAADDGWMPQTEEHLQIVSYLGVSRAVVALTKIDLLGDESGAIANIREKLGGTSFADAPIIPTSVVTGRGLEDLKNALARALQGAPSPADIGKPWLPVDRVFKLQGIGTVVTGTLTGGTLRRGQTVVLQPSEKKARIRTIQSHGRDVESSGPGTRTALNLSDVDAVEDIRRGDVVTFGKVGGPSEFLDVLMEISPRATRLIKNGARLHAHHGAGNVAARVAFFNGEGLAPGESALAQLRLEAPAFLFAGDHFILRDWSEHHTLGGAIVLDPDANRKLFRSEGRQTFLKARAESGGDLSRFVSSQLGRDGAVRISQLLLKSRFSAPAIAETLSQQAAAGELVLAGDFVVDPAKWRHLFHLAVTAIDERHRMYPEQPGPPLADLRAALQGALDVPELFDPLIADLCRGEFIRAGNAIRRKTHTPALSVPLQAVAMRIRAALAAKPFDPPSRKDLAPDPVSQQVLRFLIESGEIVDVSAEIVLGSETVKRAIEMVREFIRAHGPATTSDLRQMLGSSRRVAMPLLERLDRDAITLRQGDKRVLRK
jgi:selenocysteine-specific elongation factor